MRHLSTLFLILILFDAKSQPITKKRFGYGLKLGGANCNISGSRVPSEAKGGFLFGIFAQLRLSKTWSAQAELLKVRKGSGGWVSGRAVPGEYLLNLSYLEFPVLFKWHIKNFNVEFGPGMGVLLTQSENLIGDAYPDQTKNYPFTTNEVSFNGGFGLAFNDRWHAGFRFTHSLFPVRVQLPQIPKDVYNRAFTISVSRSLNTKKKTPDNVQG